MKSRKISHRNGVGCKAVWELKLKYYKDSVRNITILNPIQFPYNLTPYTITTADIMTVLACFTLMFQLLLLIIVIILLCRLKNWSRL
jgi:hypothetical protein